VRKERVPQKKEKRKKMKKVESAKETETKKGVDISSLF
jgi:hypothetical protein